MYMRLFKCFLPIAAFCRKLLVFEITSSHFLIPVQQVWP